MMGLRATEMATLTVESFGTVRGYATLIVVGKGDKPARVPVPIPALAAVTAAIDGRSSGPLLRTRTGAGMDRRSVHRYVAATARAAGIRRPISPHALRRTVGTVGLHPGHSAARRATAATPLPPGDDHRQLRRQRRCAGTPRLSPDRRLPRRLGQLSVAPTSTSWPDGARRLRGRRGHTATVSSRAENLLAGPRGRRMCL